MILREYIGRIKNDLTGKRFGRLLVVSYSHHNRHRFSCWNTVCACGTKKVVVGIDLGKYTNSCGCAKGKHRMCGSLTYKTWARMKERCMNPKNKNWANYGGRGILISNSWLNFSNFYKDMGKKPADKSIDRINNDGNYSKNNCKWSSPREQSNNSRMNHVLVYKGESLNVSEWARKLNINSSTLFSRLQRGWTIERILTQSV